MSRKASYAETIRRREDRGQANHGWLKTSHSFSFADYYDALHMGFGALRVINEDYVEPGHGFGMHAHRDMEIITLVLSGQLHHEDSMGHSSTIGPYEVQRITAGTGMRHSEFNNGALSTHLLQIWIEPNVRGVAPSYAQKKLPPGFARGRLGLIASADEHAPLVTIRQDAMLYLGAVHGSEGIVYDLDPSRMAYVHVVKGNIEVNGHLLRAGDALKTSSPHNILARGEEAEVLLFDLAQS